MPAGSNRKGIGGRPRGAPTTVLRLLLPLANLARHLREGTLRAGDINAFLDIEAVEKGSVPLVECTTACGFPSPADDYLDRPLNFNELLIRNPAATFAVRLAGESMTGAGLFPGDIAVVDRSRRGPAASCWPCSTANSRSSVTGRAIIGSYCKPRTPSFPTSRSPRITPSGSGASSQSRSACCEAMSGSVALS